MSDQADIPTRIASIRLAEDVLESASDELRRDCARALHDISNGSYFLIEPFTGPYRIACDIRENRLLLDVSNKDDAHEHLSLPISPFRRIIKDYFLICESHVSALMGGNHSKIEAIDMGRRGLHNEAAEKLQEILHGKAETDHDTARRLFTLICVLHRN